MFINPKTAIAKGWITHPSCNTIQDWEDHGFISPNAIDFTADRFYAMDDVPVVITNTTKSFRSMTQIQPHVLNVHCGSGRVVDINPPTNLALISSRTTVDVASDFYVDIPEGVAAWLIVRSTFNRNGMFITSGFWDSGFKGNLGCALHNNSGDALVAPGTRLGQIVFAQSDNAGVYAGGYNRKPGEHHWLVGADNE